MKNIGFNILVLFANAHTKASIHTFHVEVFYRRLLFTALDNFEKRLGKVKIYYNDLKRDWGLIEYGQDNKNSYSVDNFITITVQRRLLTK
jgi:hypothetical protein